MFGLQQFKSLRVRAVILGLKLEGSETTKRNHPRC